jgi:hypothetical protein
MEKMRIVEVDSTRQTVSEINEAIGNALISLLDIDGLEFPCHVVAIAANGTGSISRFTANRDPKGCITLAEHLEPGGLQLPMHALLLDSAGYSARLLVRAKSKGN